MAKPCKIDGCSSPASGRGWCSKHYQRWRRHGDPEHQTVYTTNTRHQDKPCAVDGCHDIAVARGWCKMHWTRWKRHGNPGPAMLLLEPRLNHADERKCVDCGETKPADAFLIDPRRKTKLLSRCRPCRTTSDREGARRRRYGITQEQYDAMLNAQGGRCAVCGGAARLCIDHEHSTGRVRGILCNNCNVALGRLGDDPGRVKSLLQYLLRD